MTSISLRQLDALQTISRLNFPTRLPPATSAISKEMGISQVTTRAHLDALYDLGLVSVETHGHQKRWSLSHSGKLLLARFESRINSAIERGSREAERF